MQSLIEIVPYSERWPEEFAAVAAGVRRALDGLALRVDPIGSTAVPGLAAKDVIDVQVTVRELEPAVREGLARLGYEWLSDISGDHRPPHAEGPDSDWGKWIFRGPGDWRRVNLHVRVAGRPNQRYPLLFRDYLRSNPVAASAYGILKEQLARKDPADWDFYYDVKDPACDIIWSAAEEWARATGWEPTP